MTRVQLPPTAEVVPDEIGDYPEVRVTVDLAHLGRSFIRACHEFAGENGAVVRFCLRGDTRRIALLHRSDPRFEAATT